VFSVSRERFHAERYKPHKRQSEMNEHPEQPPFEGHRRYYIFVKVAVLVLAALLALNLLGLV